MGSSILYSVISILPLSPYTEYFILIMLILCVASNHLDAEPCSWLAHRSSSSPRQSKKWNQWQWVLSVTDPQGQCGYKKACVEVSLVFRWLQILLPRLGTGVRSLVQEDATCHGATRPPAPQWVSPSVGSAEGHAPWARAPQPEKHRSKEPARLSWRAPRSLQPEKTPQWWSPSAAESKHTCVWEEWESVMLCF